MPTKYPKDLQSIISFLKKLPGVGTKTAERFAFQLISWSKEEQALLGELISSLKEKITQCPSCGALMELSSCSFCSSNTRNRDVLCIVSSPKDIYAIEETRTFSGIYYVIKCLLSPIDGHHAEDLALPHLHEYIVKNNTKEVVIALDSTLEGDATALYLKGQLSAWGVSVTRLAYGLPVGSSLDYIDGSTLARALTGRQIFQ